MALDVWAPLLTTVTSKLRTIARLTSWISFFLYICSSFFSLSKVAIRSYFCQARQAWILACFSRNGRPSIAMRSLGLANDSIDICNTNKNKFTLISHTKKHSILQNPLSCKIMQEEEEALHDISISFSEKPQIQPNNFNWVKFSLSKNREVCYFQQVHVPEEVEKAPQSGLELQLPQENRLHQVADDIRQRYLKYGKLDSTQKIAKKTGAAKRDEVHEKDNNYYDQDDPFIDDSDCPENNQGPRMALPDVTFSDFVCVSGDIKTLKNSAAYKEKIQLLKSYEAAEPKEREPKPATKHSDKKPQKKVKANPTHTHHKAINPLTHENTLDLASLLKSLGGEIKEEEKQKTAKTPKKKQQKQVKEKGKVDATAKTSNGSHPPDPPLLSSIILDSEGLAKLMTQLGNTGPQAIQIDDDERNC